MPLVGCLDLLLADIEQASARFSSSSDENLRDWLNSYPCLLYTSDAADE